MKRFFVYLFLAVLLCKIPATEFNKIPDKDEFLRLLGQVFNEQTSCLKSVVGAMEIGNEIYFFGDCLIQEGAERGKRTDM